MYCMSSVTCWEVGQILDFMHIYISTWGVTSSFCCYKYFFTTSSIVTQSVTTFMALMVFTIPSNKASLVFWTLIESECCQGMQPDSAESCRHHFFLAVQVLWREAFTRYYITWLQSIHQMPNPWSSTTATGNMSLAMNSATQPPSLQCLAEGFCFWKLLVINHLTPTLNQWLTRTAGKKCHPSRTTLIQMLQWPLPG